MAVARTRAVRGLAAVLLLASLAGCGQGTAPPAKPAASHSTPSKHPEPRPVSWTWTPRAPRSFVPQGLVRAGDRLYITGYRWAAWRFEQRCQVLVLDTTDGTRIDRATGLRDPSVPGATAAGPACHHGGGVAYSRAGLWIAGSGRLWLVDPDDPARVRRSWAVAPAISASTVAVRGDRLYVATYGVNGGGRLADVALRDLLARGVTTLAGQDGPGVAQARVRPAPDFVQGIALDDRGIWLSRSTSRCGDLVRPHGARRRLIPGAEGLILVGRAHAWVLSESGSPHYQSLGGRPDVPMLSYVDLRQLPPGRCFRA